MKRFTIVVDGGQFHSLADVLAGSDDLADRRAVMYAIEMARLYAARKWELAHWDTITGLDLIVRIAPMSEDGKAFGKERTHYTKFFPSTFSMDQRRILTPQHVHGVFPIPLTMKECSTCKTSY
jgi:hypothetical protein